MQAPVKRPFGYTAFFQRKKRNANAVNNKSRVSKALVQAAIRMEAGDPEKWGS
jgi:hypothetical protein